MPQTKWFFFSIGSGVVIFMWIVMIFEGVYVFNQIEHKVLCLTDGIRTKEDFKNIYQLTSISKGTTVSGCSICCFMNWSGLRARRPRKTDWRSSICARHNDQYHIYNTQSYITKKSKMVPKCLTRGVEKQQFTKSMGEQTKLPAETYGHMIAKINSNRGYTKY